MIHYSLYSAGHVATTCKVEKDDNHHRCNREAHAQLN